MISKFLEMLKATRAIVADAVQQGKTTDQIKQAHLLAKYEDLGKGFIKTEAWIDVLYEDVTKKPGSALEYQNHGHANEKK